MLCFAVGWLVGVEFWILPNFNDEYCGKIFGGIGAVLLHDQSAHDDHVDPTFPPPPPKKSLPPQNHHYRIIVLPDHSC